MSFLKVGYLEMKFICLLVLTLVANKESLDSLLTSHIRVMLTMLFDHAPNILSFIVGLSTCSCVDLVLAISSVVGRLETLSST